MRVLSITFAIVILFLLTDIGFAQEEKPEVQSSRTTTSESAESTNDSQPTIGENGTPVPLKDDTAKLSPNNTRVEFVGTHEGPKPDPRIGGFEKFSGDLVVNSGGESVKSLMLDFETGSMFTKLGNKLTTHLKSDDFLNVKKYPQAKFVSTQIGEQSEDGMFEITGDFTLMGKTKEISFPARMKSTEDGVLLQSQFQIDRTDFGMNKMTAKVSKAVSIKLSVGEKTVVGKEKPKNAPMVGRTRDRAQGAFDPNALFKRWDKDGDGALTGREIPPRMKQQMGRFDGDGDGKVSLDEWKKGVRGQ
ncbi:YceI family protein [Saprospiraceae bacterium]|nr:YceI family protein [Saprospiraceae bacterium]